VSSPVQGLLQSIQVGNHSPRQLEKTKFFFLKIFAFLSPLQALVVVLSKTIPLFFIIQKLCSSNNKLESLVCLSITKVKTFVSLLYNWIADCHLRLRTRCQQKVPQFEEVRSWPNSLYAAQEQRRACFNQRKWHHPISKCRWKQIHQLLQASQHRRFIKKIDLFTLISDMHSQTCAQWPLSAGQCWVAALRYKHENWCSEMILEHQLSIWWSLFGYIRVNCTVEKIMSKLKHTCFKFLLYSRDKISFFSVSLHFRFSVFV